jgi:hypothetical protein
MISGPVTRYVLTAAMRDRLIPAIFILMAVSASMSIFLGGAAVVEAGQFAAVFTAGSLRFVATFGMVLFVVFFIRRSFENKDVEYLLSRPVGRVRFILSHALAFSILALITGLLATLCVISLVPHAYYGAALMWSASLIAELIIMVNVALFFSMVLPSATTGVMATMALYMLARLMGELLGTLDKEGQSALYMIMGVVMQGVSLIVPRLDLMAQTSWLIYGEADISWLFILSQTVIYSGLVLAASIIDLSRRQF